MTEPVTKNLLVISLLAFLLLPIVPSSAQQLVDRYRARLSEGDHFNSSGQRLTNPASIIRQDRANFHRFGAGDPEDETDKFFADSKNREILERLLQRGRADPDAVRAIINSTPLVQIEIWRDAQGPYIIVTGLPEPRPQTTATGANGSAIDSPKPSGGGSGSGFFVSSSGHVVTNEHVVSGCSRIEIIDADRQRHAGRVIATSKNDDLALLKVDARPSTTADFSMNRRLVQGATVITYGFPLAPLLSSSGNVSTGLVTALAGLADNPRQLQISAPVQPGNSGGPLVDARGVLVGVVVAKLNAVALAGAIGDIPQNVNFAIKASAVEDLLEAHGVPYLKQEVQREAVIEEATRSVRAYTVRVECN